MARGIPYLDTAPIYYWGAGGELCCCTVLLVISWQQCYIDSASRKGKDPAAWLCRRRTVAHTS